MQAKKFAAAIQHAHHQKPGFDFFIDQAEPIPAPFLVVALPACPRGLRRQPHAEPVVHVCAAAPVKNLSAVDKFECQRKVKTVPTRPYLTYRRDSLSLAGPIRRDTC